MPRVDEPSTNGHANANGKPAVLDRLLAKLQKVTETSNGWKACCPAHDDNHPSLDIGIGTNRRILLHCKSVGCSFESIITALGFHASDLAPGNTARPSALGEKLDRLKSFRALPNGKTGAGGNGVLKCLSDAEERDLLRSAGKRTISQLKEDSSRPLPFPLEVFPEALKQFVEESAASLPCPPDYIGLAVLVVTSSFIGPDRPIQIKQGWEERAAVYGVTVGPTGSRKSPALELGMTPARQRDRKLAAEHKVAKQEHEHKRREAKANKKDFNDPAPVAKQHVTTDTTVEALADVLGWNPRGLLVYRDEASGWVASLNQYKGGKGSDRQFWLSAWSCQDYTVNRKGQEPLRITRPFLSVIGNIPPDMLGELADRRGREDGFIDRILFVYPDPVQVKWTDDSPDPALLEKYVEACLAIGKMPDQTLTLTRPAQLEFAQWYDEHNRSHDGPAGSWAKMDGYCARLACILHHLRLAYADKQELKSLRALAVGVESVRGAITLIDYFKNHARRALGRMTAGKEGKVLGRLLAFVVNSPDYRVRPRTLIAAQIAPNADEARAMLQRLAGMGMGEMKQGKRKDEVLFQGRNDLEEIAGQFEEAAN